MQEIRLAEESSKQNANPLSSQEKAELAHSRTQMLLQLARWMAHTGQGAKADVTGRLQIFTLPPDLSFRLLEKIVWISSCQGEAFEKDIQLFFEFKLIQWGTGSL